MSTTYTTNYHLGKQTDTSDNFDMSVITDNMDIIDTQMKSNENNILLKANTTDVNTATANLQAQIDQIAQAAGTGTADTEVAQARVGDDGTSYNTLKARLDAENTEIKGDISIVTNSVTEVKNGLNDIAVIVSASNMEQGTWTNGEKAPEPKRIRSKEKIKMQIGTTIEIHPNGLYLSISQYEDDETTTASESSGWIGGSEPVIFVKVVKEYVTILVANGATFATSTNIAVSDYVCEIKCMNTLQIQELETKVSDVSFIDIINTAFKQTNQYAYDTNGIFSIDSSNKWTAYWFDATRIETIAEIFSNIVYTNTMRYVQFAFFASETPSNASKIKYYCYDIDGENYVRNAPVPSNAVLAMLFLRNVDNDGSEYVKGTYYGSLYDVSKDVDVLKKNAPPASGYSYSGEKIKLDNYFTYKSLAIACYGQDGCISGDYFFSFNNQGSCKVYSLLSKSNVVNFNLDQYSTIKPHCNAVVFGGTKFDNNDVFPLLYVNAYNAPDIAYGTLYVHRILTDEDGVPTGTSLIQTVTIGFTNQPIWDDGNNLSPYGNFFVDTDNGFLYAYVPKTTQNVTRFFKFPLPDISIGSVTLEESDIIEYFDTDYILYPQGNCYNSGKAYILSGISVGTGFLSVVNLESKRIVSRIDFYKSIGAEWEPEVIDVYKGKLLLGQSPLLEFTF